MGWKFKGRKEIRFGPLFAYLTPRGVSSWGWKSGPFRRNVTHGRDTVNTPGWGSIQRTRSRR